MPIMAKDVNARFRPPFAEGRCEARSVLNLPLLRLRHALQRRFAQHSYVIELPCKLELKLTVGKRSRRAVDSQSDYALTGINVIPGANTLKRMIRPTC